MSKTALSSNPRLLDTLFTDLIREVKNEEARLSKSLKERLERHTKLKNRQDQRDKKKRRHQTGNKDVSKPDIRDCDRTSIPWSNIHLDPIVKDLLPNASANNPSQVAAFRESNQISIQQFRTNTYEPDPFLNIHEKEFRSPLLEAIDEYFKSPPTALYQEAWGILMRGHNLFGITCDTGEKMIAYLFPALMHILRQKLTPPIVLILTSTKERVKLLQEYTDKFSIESNVDSSNIKICHPTEYRKIADLKTVTYVIIDDLNKIIDGDYSKIVKAFLTLVRPDRQMSVWSSIWSQTIQDYVAEIMPLDGYIRLNIGSLNFLKQLRVKEMMYVCPMDKDKSEKIKGILQDITKDSKVRIKMIVYTGNYHRLQALMYQITAAGILTSTINLNQEDDTNIKMIKRFRQNSDNCALLVNRITAYETDFGDVTHVINYDFPLEAFREYLHRLGRIGKLNNLQTVYSLFERLDYRSTKELIAHLLNNNQFVDRLLHLYAEESPENFRYYLKQKKKRKFQETENANRKEYHETTALERVGIALEKASAATEKSNARQSFSRCSDNSSSVQHFQPSNAPCTSTNFGQQLRSTDAYSVPANKFNDSSLGQQFRPSATQTSIGISRPESPNYSKQHPSSDPFSSSNSKNDYFQSGDNKFNSFSAGNFNSSNDVFRNEPVSGFSGVAFPQSSYNQTDNFNWSGGSSYNQSNFRDGGNRFRDEKRTDNQNEDRNFTSDRNSNNFSDDRNQFNSNNSSSWGSNNHIQWNPLNKKSKYL